MKLKTLTITVAILAVLCLAAWFATKPPASTGADPRVGQPLVSRDTVKSATQVKLSDQGKSVLLKRQADGTWQVASYHDFPADFGKLSSFVRDLSEAKVERFVTANPERFERLEFKDSAITLLGADGKELWKLTLGKNAETGGRFVHFDDEKRAYLTRLNAWIDPEAMNWADTTLLHFKPDDIAKVTLDFPGAAPVTARRDKAADPFTADAPEGKTLKIADIANLIRSLSELRFTDTTAPDDPAAVEAARHARTVRLTTFDGTTYAIALGRTPETTRPKPANADLATNGTPPKPATSDAKASGAPKPTPAATEEKVPAGPVFVAITTSDPKSELSRLMHARAFKVADYIFTSLPAGRSDLFEPAAAAPAAPTQPTPPSTPAPAPSPAAAGS